MFTRKNILVVIIGLLLAAVAVLETPRGQSASWLAGQSSVVQG